MCSCLRLAAAARGGLLLEAGLVPPQAEAHAALVGVGVVEGRAEVAERAEERGVVRRARWRVVRRVQPHGVVAVRLRQEEAAAKGLVAQAADLAGRERRVRARTRDGRT